MYILYIYILYMYTYIHIYMYTYIYNLLGVPKMGDFPCKKR